jgi:hypothetical protein
MVLLSGLNLVIIKVKNETIIKTKEENTISSDLKDNKKKMAHKIPIKDRNSAML